MVLICMCPCGCVPRGYVSARVCAPCICVHVGVCHVGMCQRGCVPRVQGTKESTVLGIFS